LASPYVSAINATSTGRYQHIRAPDLFRMTYCSPLKILRCGTSCRLHCG